MRRRSGLRWSLLLILAGLGALLMVAIYTNSGKIPVPFTSLAHDQNLGRPYNRYIVGVPDLLVIADPTDVDQLDAYLRRGAPRDRAPLSVVESLRHLDYDRDFALLILQGMSGGNSHVTVQQIVRQAGRVLVQADFVTPRPGEGQTGNVTDAYQLVAMAKAGFIGQQLHFELWDGWRKRKEVVAYVGDVPRAPARTTVTPVLPTFTLKGNLVYFAAFKKHIGFYPVPTGIEEFKKELSVYEGGKGSIKFPFDKPIPYDLISKIVKFRAKENLERAEAKRKKK